MRTAADTGVMQPQVRSLQKLGENGRLPGETSPASQASGIFSDGGAANVCCLKPPRLRCFVTEAPGSPRGAQGHRKQLETVGREGHSGNLNKQG